MDDFIKSLGIDKEGHFNNDEYIITAKDLMELSSWYNILTRSEDVDENEDQSKVSVDFVDIHFNGNKYNIALFGDMDEDVYELIVQNVEEE